jgi:radical SAM protein with 4Fe4S-binding SPASM domain
MSLTITQNRNNQNVSPGKMGMSVGQKELVNRIIDAGLKPPETLTLMITQGCNLNCPHCLLDCQQADRTPPVAGDIIMRLAAEFGELGGKRILLTGGEPLTHPEWLEILEFACRQTEFCEVGLQTNAALMSENDIHGLLSLPIDKLALEVSLDGANPGTNDLVRGDGSFEATMKVLRLLSAAGLGDRTTVAFTEMRHNYDELPDVVELVHALGLGRLVSGTLVKGGRSLHSDWVELPRASQVRALIDKYHQDPAFSEIYERVGNIAAIEWFKGRASASDQVCSCIRTPFINAQGKMYPCVMYLNNALVADGVHDRPLRTAIAEALPKWAELPEISRRRSVALSACEGCPGHAHCAGGCMGRADAAQGNVMSVEDRCHLRREVYSWEPAVE